MKKLLIIDGNSILNRAYYGIRPLTAPDGTPTNAVYGFLNILFKYLEEETPDYLCVAFDVKEKTFRHKKYDLYKAQRKPAPEDFLVQLPLMKEVLKAMNCMCMELPGWEADDIIGTVSRLCEEADVDCRILTGDKDDLQLCSNKTTVKLVVTRMGKTTTTDYGIAEFAEKYQMTPKSFIDLKALMGDSSDNIPGVKGIGEKTALSLIQNYKTIDKIYQDIDSIEVTDNVRKKLTEGKEDAFLSYELATIDRFAPVAFDFKDAEMSEYNKPELAKLFTRLNFRSFLQKLELNTSAATDISKEISGKGREVDFDTLVSACEKAGEASYILDRDTLCVKPKNLEEALLSSGLDKKSRIAFFANKSIAKVGFNIKEDIIALSEYGIDKEELGTQNLKFDVMLGAYILDPTQSEYRLDELCLKYLSALLCGGDDTKQDDQISMLNIIENSADNTELFNKVFAIEALSEKMAELIEENQQHQLYYDVELPLLQVLADLQIRGMYIDKEALSQFGTMLQERINIVSNEIFELSGEEFNINSPKQLGVILFEKLSLPFGKKK